METFVATHPSVVMWFIGLLGTAVVALAGAFWGLLGRRIARLEEADKTMGSQIAGVEKTLVEYQGHIGAAQSDLQGLHGKLRSHMEQEETQVWGKIEELLTKLTAIEIENVKAHGFISERLAKVETKMPNGQLERLIALLEKGGRR